MRYIFLVIYIIMFFNVFRTALNLAKAEKKQEAIIGLFMSFLIVPDFIILDAYGLPGTFIFVFIFMALIPILSISNSGVIRLTKNDIHLIVVLLIILIYAVYTKSMMKTTEYFDLKLFNYIYTLVVPVFILIRYKEIVVEAYDVWKPVLINAILAYAFKNFSLVGIVRFRDLYLANYSELKNVIFAAQILGIGALICLYDLIRSYDAKTMISLGALLLQILLFESRGPILSIAFAFVIMWWFHFRKDKIIKKLNIRMLLRVIAFAIIMIASFRYLWNAGYLERLVDKMAMLTSGNRNETRYFLYPIVIQAIRQHFPYGVGFGNSRIAVMNINSYFNNNYPHNIILELLLEEGIIISIPVIALFVKWLFSIRVRNKYRYHTLLFFVLFIFSFVNSMISGDIAGNANVFFFGYLANFSRYISKREFNT